MGTAPKRKDVGEGEGDEEEKEGDGSGAEEEGCCRSAKQDQAEALCSILFGRMKSRCRKGKEMGTAPKRKDVGEGEGDEEEKEGDGSGAEEEGCCRSAKQDQTEALCSVLFGRMKSRCRKGKEMGTAPKRKDIGKGEGDEEEKEGDKSGAGEGRKGLYVRAKEKGGDGAASEREGGEETGWRVWRENERIV